MVILNQNDLGMKKWGRNDRDEKPSHLGVFPSEWPGMTHFCHSYVIPSFGDEDEWDEVDQFPYREIDLSWFLMHIYDKQCEIMQKNQLKSPNFQIQCFYNETVLKKPKKHKN